MDSVAKYITPLSSIIQLERFRTKKYLLTCNNTIMKIKHCISFLFLLTFSFANAQNNYYYYKGNKVSLTLNKNQLTISTFDGFKTSSIGNQNFKKVNFIYEKSKASQNKIKYAQLEFKKNITDKEYSQKLNSLRDNPNIKSVMPNYITINGKKIGMSDYFYVKLKDINDISKLEQLANSKNVEIIEQNKFMPLWYTLRCKKDTKDNTLITANAFYETGLFSSATADFLYDDILCANDEDFDQLWGLNNTLNPNIDINACDAWTITEGSSINVAVLDQGIELTHDDLEGNISPISYDTESNSSPSQVFGNHGTHVAGTIAAIKDNTLQVVGVAPQATLISVSNSLAGTPNSRIRRADGINWAWQNGADIISNSWGSAVQYDVIDDAIENALENGRDGKGCVIVFATGNDFGNVAYPANSNPNILAVGSITSTGVRSDFSNFGNELDVVAPGSGILSTITGNSIDTFDGTSMATPHVAGIAALVLSINPDLSAEDVNDIIESSAQKVGGYIYFNTPNRGNGNWNNEMGYGLVNAFEAVQMAINYNGNDNQSHFITGPAQITPGYRAFYSMNPYPNATNYVWSIPSGCHYHYCWGITQGQGTNVLGIKAGKTGRQDITCTIYNGNTVIGSQYITVNVQNPYGGGGNGGGNGDPCGGLYLDQMLILPPEPCDGDGFDFNGQQGKLYFKYLIVYNIQGQKVKEFDEKQEVNIADLAVGIYIIKAELSNNELITKKIFINK